jgi:hypothetical protein
MFNVGDKVICIDNKLKHSENIIKDTLRVGTIYTVRSLCDTDAIRLNEIEMIKEPVFENIEHALYSWRFRKVWNEKQLQKINQKNYCEV